MDCPYCYSKLILTLNRNLTEEECTQCDGIRLENSGFNEQGKKSRHISKEYNIIEDWDVKDGSFYYYKKII